MAKQEKDPFYIDHHSCKMYLDPVKKGFTFVTIENGQITEEKKTKEQHLLFVLDGQVDIICGEYPEKTLHSQEMILITSDLYFKMISKGRSKLMVLKFDQIENPCDKATYRTYLDLAQYVKHDFEAVKIRPQTILFIEVLNTYLSLGMNCFHLHKMKIDELFLSFRMFYTSQEIIKLFYPIIQNNSDFKSLILKRQIKYTSCEDFSAQLNMSKTSLRTKFKEEFGIPIHQWMQVQKKEKIKLRAADPDVSIITLIDEFGFASHSSFFRFCKKYFGTTPKELIKHKNLPE